MSKKFIEFTENFADALSSIDECGSFEFVPSLILTIRILSLLWAGCLYNLSIEENGGVVSMSITKFVLLKSTDNDDSLTLAIKARGHGKIIGKVYIEPDVKSAVTHFKRIIESQHALPQVLP
jgi:hypothetical protein